MNNPIKTEERALPKRKHPRLKEFDYSLPYPYFVTICTQDKRPFFCERAFAEVVVKTTRDLAAKHRYLLHAYCLMPNHLHLLVWPDESGCTLME